MRLIWDADGKKYATQGPTPELIEELIEDLDNDTRTMVALDVRGRSCMMVIGGADGRVRVNYIPEDLEQPSQHLVDPEANGDTIDLKMQSRAATYAMRHTVPKSIGVQAMVLFTQSQAPSAELYWTND